ncbi:PTS sugar transporter subunit IIA [Enterococcus faecium]
MMTDSVFVKENIFINEEPISDKMALFKYISENAKHLNYVLSEQDCFDGLVDRESQQTTGFQDGFAIPHCKNDTVVSPKMLYVKQNQFLGIVLIAKILLIPEKGAEEHLKILAKIARSLIDGGYRDSLKKRNQKSLN